MYNVILATNHLKIGKNIQNLLVLRSLNFKGTEDKIYQLQLFLTGTIIYNECSHKPLKDFSDRYLLRLPPSNNYQPTFC